MDDAAISWLWSTLRSFPDAESTPPPPDLRVLEPLLVRHGLTGVVDHALRSQSPPVIRRAAMASAARTLRVKRLLHRVLEALGKQGLHPVLLKGYGLGARLYPSPLLRATSDVDVLLPREALAGADTALTQLGLTRLSEETEAYRLEHHHHVNYSGDEGLVELHFRALTAFGTSLEAEALYKRSRLSVLDGSTVRYLAAGDELPYLAAHASGHLLQRLSWLLDLKLFVACHRSLDWDQVISLARGAGLSSPIYFAFEAAQLQLGALIPAEVLRALRPSALQQALGRRLFSADRLVEAPLQEHKYLAHLATMFLATTPRHMARYAAHHTLHAAKRRAAARFPDLAPRRWRG